jgi:hypothetical protein
MALMTLEEFRTLAKKEKTKTTSYDDRYDFSVLPTVKTEGKIIVGIDPDTVNAGCAVYDSAGDNVLFYELVKPTKIREFLFDTVQQHGRPNVVVKLEVPTMATIFGTNERLKRSLTLQRLPKVTIEQRCLMHLFHSARCNEKANAIIQQMDELALTYELVPSDHRMNFESKKLKPMKDEDFMPTLVSRVLAGNKRIYPSKVSAAKLKRAFPQVKVAGEEDQRDALMLCIKEAILLKLKARNKL